MTAAYFLLAEPTGVAVLACCCWLLPTHPPTPSSPTPLRSRHLLLSPQVYEVMVGGRKRGPLQRFYPQCQRCSIKQATAVRNGKRVLVLHLHWPRLNRGDTLAGGAGAGENLYYS